MSSANKCTCFTLRKLTRTVSRLYDLHLAREGLKTTQYSLLRNISGKGMSIAALATAISTDRTTLTRNLKPLIDAGWASSAAGADARQRIVTITPAGKTKVDAARVAWRAAQNELETILGAELTQALHLDADAAMQRLTPLLTEKLHASLD